MQLVHVDDVEWFGTVAHREGGINFKRLISGDDLTPNNFELNLVEVEEHYETPRHRHNFDQVRFQLDGSFGYDQDMEQQPGTVGYFGEGTYYQQHGEGMSHTLLLQTANASAAPYMSYPTLRATVNEMIEKKIGEFHGGIFTGYDNGKKYNKDGFEAAWEHATGQQISYPKPRYERPVIMDPANFGYVPLVQHPGVSRKLLGSFTERELTIGMLKLAAGAAFGFEGKPDEEHLFYVLSGTGELNGQAWRPGSAGHLGGAEGHALQAESEAEIFYLRLPTRL